MFRCFFCCISCHSSHSFLFFYIFLVVEARNKKKFLNSFLSLVFSSLLMPFGVSFLNSYHPRSKEDRIPFWYSIFALQTPPPPTPPPPIPACLIVEEPVCGLKWEFVCIRHTVGTCPPPPSLPPPPLTPLNQKCTLRGSFSFWS